MAKQATAKRGRPTGAKTEQKPIVEYQVSRCPNCGSTDRTSYADRRELAYSGTTPDGRQYDRIVWRSCKCEACGQARIDKTFELTAAT